jgi:hypothetical protein
MTFVDCSIKGVKFDQPHARVRVEILRVEGSRYYFRPPQVVGTNLYRPGGVHFKLHLETLGEEA